MNSDTLRMDPAFLLQLLQSRASGGVPFGSLPFEMPLDDANGDSINEEDGRSRKYREGQGWELQGPLSSVVARRMIRTPNPVVPLRFEQPPGAWQGYDYLLTEAQGVVQFASDFVSPDVMNAHLKALDAYCCYTWQEAASTAQEALAISAVCPEAYNVLALSAANSYEEALQLYRKAEELGPKVLRLGCFEEVIKEKKLWPRVSYRAYFRAMYGVANTLRKMGRYEESLLAYDKLLDADGNWYSWTSYVNVMSLYPFVVMGAKGPKAVLDYMRNYQHTADHFSYISSSTYWSGAFVLADLLVTEAKGTSKRAEGAKVTPEDGWAADGIDVTRLGSDGYGNSYKGVRGRPLFCFCHTYPQAVDQLLGDKPLPHGLKPVCSASKGDTADSLAYTTGAQWRSHPTVIERLRRYRNTYEVRALVQDLRCKGLSVDIKDIRHYMDAPGGWHTQALEKIGSDGRVRSVLDVLVDYPDGREFGADEIKVLKWLLEAGAPVHNTHPSRVEDQPLHMVCYQGYGPQAVKALLSAGADPFRPNKQGLTAIAMTANQGNWREVQALLQALPHLKTKNAADVSYCRREHLSGILRKLTVPESLIVDLFHSSVLPCLAGGPKCMRCSNGIPHSPHADFFKFADIIITEADIRKLNKIVVEEMEESARQSGPSSPWTRLHKFVMRAIEKNKKSPPAKQQPSSSSAAAAAAAATTSSAAVSSAAQIAPAGSSSSSGRAPSSKAATQQSKAAAAPGDRQCWGCGFKPGPDQTLQKCGGCRKAVFCSKQCLERAWKAHKPDCKKWQAERAAAKGAKPS